MEILKNNGQLTTLFIVAIVTLAVTWWTSGLEDTWLYIFCVGLIIMSAWEVYSSKNKDNNK